jgi:hypothetical protein
LFYARQFYLAEGASTKRRKFAIYSHQNAWLQNTITPSLFL